jgi:hypothetical protein
VATAVGDGDSDHSHRGQMRWEKCQRRRSTEGGADAPAK